MQDRKEHVKLVSRYPNTARGGGNVKIDSVTLLESLVNAGLDPDQCFIVRRYVLKGNKGTAEILLKIKPVK